MIRLPEGLKIEEVPVEKRYRSVTAGLVRRIKLLYDAIHRRYGNDGLDLIREVGRDYGLEIARRAKKRFGSGDIRSVGLYVIRIFNTIRGEGEVVEFSDKRVVIRVRKCPYPWETPEVCEAHTQMEKSLVEALGENLTYRIESSIPKGDPYCDHIIEPRREERT
ncbi:hypothetical protein ACFL2T_02535 [Elusimicrobiota bacterium]